MSTTPTGTTRPPSPPDAQRRLEPEQRPERVGPLTRFTVAVYGVLAITVCFVVASLPYLIVVLVLPQPLLLAISAGSVGPAWVATLATTDAYLRNRDLEPVRLFAHHWRASAPQALVFSVPFALLAGSLLVGVAAGPPRPGIETVALIALAIAGLLWASTVLLLIARFSFRLRDVMRLAVWALVRSPHWLVAGLALLVLTVGLLALAGQLVVGALAVPIAMGVLVNARPVLAAVRSEFTVEGQADRLERAQ